MRLLIIFVSIALLGNATAQTFGLYTYVVNPDDVSVTITDYPTDATGAIEIPATIDGRSVTHIGDNAFYNCSSLTSITIPSSVTSIGDYAFRSCIGLTSITIPSSVTSIGDYAFRYCSGLTSVTIPDSVTSIDDGTFEGCSGLTSITIPSSVTSIGSSAFQSCSGLTSVTIPDSVTSIGSHAFLFCTGLTSVTIPDSVTSIGSTAFRSCSGLTSINIPNGVISIGNQAFQSCAGLTSAIIGNSVTSIGSTAFFECLNLVSIRLESMTAPTIEPSAFASISAAAIIYYPFGATGYAAVYDGVPTFLSITADDLNTAVASATTQGQQDVVADPASYGLYTSATAQAQLIDLRTGSTMLNISGTNAVMQLQIQRSDDLSTWTSSSEDLIEVELPMQQGKGFYRFAMPQE